MEIDPFIFRLSIFILSIFVGYYVVWSVTPSLHTPLMSVTNAISSVIIVRAIIAGLAGESESIFNTSSIFGLLAISLAAINIFWWIFSNTKNVSYVQKKEKGKIMISANLSAIFYLVSGILFILALKRLCRLQKLLDKVIFWNLWNDHCNNSHFFIYWKFLKWLLFM